MGGCTERFFSAIANQHCHDVAFLINHVSADWLKMCPCAKMACCRGHMPAEQLPLRHENAYILYIWIIDEANLREQILSYALPVTFNNVSRPPASRPCAWPFLSFVGHFQYSILPFTFALCDIVNLLYVKTGHMKAPAAQETAFVDLIGRKDSKVQPHVFYKNAYEMFNKVAKSLYDCACALL